MQAQLALTGSHPPNVVTPIELGLRVGFEAHICMVYVL